MSDSWCQVQYCEVVSVSITKEKKILGTCSLTTCVNQGTLKLRELKKENERLVHEVEKLKKIQETCMTILESRNINPGMEFALCLHPSTPSPECFFFFCRDYSQEIWTVLPFLGNTAGIPGFGGIFCGLRVRTAFCSMPRPG